MYAKGCIQHEVACARVLAIFYTTFWPMSIGEDSKPELKLKDIGRLIETRDR